MSAFEFYFSFYGLILGLTVTEIITGLVRVFRQRDRARIGWCTPLLGLALVLDISTFWSRAWESMQDVQVTYGMLVIGLVIAGIYYAAASLVTPDDLESWPDFDAFYDRHKAYVILGVAAANTIAFQLTPLLSPEGRATWADVWLSPSGLFTVIVSWTLALGLIFIRHRRVNIALLVLLVGLYLHAAIRSLAPGF